MTSQHWFELCKQTACGIKVDKDEKGIPTEGFVLKTITVSNSKTSSNEAIKVKLFYPVMIK